MRSDILNKLRAEIERRAEAQKAQIESEANMLCLCAEMLLANDRAATPARIFTEIAPALSDNRDLSVKELAARWGVSTRSIYEWKLHGLPYKKVGRLLRFDPIKVDQWANGHQESFNKARFRVVR